MMATSNSIELPEGICLCCFNEQQYFTFPFMVYCRHGRVLAVIHGRREHATFPCAPRQLQAVTDRLQGLHGGL